MGVYVGDTCMINCLYEWNWGNSHADSVTTGCCGHGVRQEHVRAPQEGVAQRGHHWMVRRGFFCQLSSDEKQCCFIPMFELIGFMIHP